MKKTIATLSLFTLLIQGFSTAQERRQVRMQAPTGSSKMTLSEGFTTFPFELISNHIVIPVEINGTIVKLILDTGMPIEGAILFGSETINKLNLSFVGKAPIKGAGGSTVVSDLAMDINFTVPGVEFSGQMVMAMPYEAIRNNQFEGRNGIIGTSIFKYFVTSIDYDKMKITLTEPGQFSYSGKGEQIPIETGRYPMTSCEVEMESGEKVPVNLVIDTGNIGTLSLNVGSAEAIILPDKPLEINKFSIQQEIPSFLGRINAFRIGGFHFTDVLSSFSQDQPPPWSKEGNLGQGILKRFNVVFDFSHKTMILEPNNHFNSPFEFNMSGFSYIRTEEGLFKITRIIPDSPAAESGLRKDDLLLGINGQSVTDLSGDEISELLKQDNGKLTLEIQRNGEKSKVSLRLRRLI